MKNSKMTYADAYMEWIEEALDLKLSPKQKSYISYGGDSFSGRSVGKTMAYCIRLALSCGDPINITHIDDHINKLGFTGNEQYSRKKFKEMFIEIHQRLKQSGFPVREIYIPTVMDMTEDTNKKYDEFVYFIENVLEMNLTEWQKLYLKAFTVKNNSN